MTARVQATIATVHHAVYRTYSDALVNLVYQNQRWRPNQIKSNLIVSVACIARLQSSDD